MAKKRKIVCKHIFKNEDLQLRKEQFNLVLLTVISDEINNSFNLLKSNRTQEKYDD